MEIKKLKEKLKESISETQEIVIENRNNALYAEGYCFGLGYALQLIDDDDPEEDEEE